MARTPPFTEAQNAELREIVTTLLMASGKSQRDLAQFFGLSQTSLWSFLNGDSGMGKRTAATLAEAAGTGIEDVVSGQRRSEIIDELMATLRRDKTSMNSRRVLNRIRQAMAARDMGASEFAEAIDSSPARADRILAGHFIAGRAFIQKVAAALGVEEEWLMGEGDDSAAETVSPLLKYRPDFAASLAIAQELRPQHGAYVWNALADSAPLVTVPITPALLVDLADVLVKYIVPPTKNSPGA